MASNPDMSSESGGWRSGFSDFSFALVLVGFISGPRRTEMAIYYPGKDAGLTEFFCRRLAAEGKLDPQKPFQAGQEWVNFRFSQVVASAPLRVSAGDQTLVRAGYFLSPAVEGAFGESARTALLQELPNEPGVMEKLREKYWPFFQSEGFDFG